MGAIACEVDVSDSDAVEQAAARVESELEPIDVWINNAMASVFGSFLDMTPDEFEGTILQVGSALAYRGIPLQSANYCAGKHSSVRHPAQQDAPQGSTRSAHLPT